MMKAVGIILLVAMLAIGCVGKDRGSKDVGKMAVSIEDVKAE